MTMLQVMKNGQVGYPHLDLQGVEQMIFISSSMEGLWLLVHSFNPSDAVIILD
jgi:hypothetical protein